MVLRVAERATDLLLDAAREGDEDAFGQLVGGFRDELRAHCYRMLGSVHDAEDAVQEGLVRAWRGLSGYAGQGSFRAWLYKIVTNRALTLAARRPGRVLPAGLGAPTVETVWVEPYPDDTGAVDAGPEARYEQRESVELAFVAAVQHLPARGRAVLLLRDVLGFSAREVAESLETSVAAVNSALQRARGTIAERLPARSQQATLRSVGEDGVRRLVERYVRAWQDGDVKAIVGMLTEDATFSMPPATTWYRGLDAIESFLISGPLTERWRFLPVRAGGQVAFGTYRWDEASAGYVADAIDVLTLRGERVSEITAFIFPELFAYFGLPDRLEAS